MDNHVNAKNINSHSKEHQKDSDDDNQSAIQNLQLNNFKRTNATSDEDNYSSCYSQNFQNTLDENFSELSEQSKSRSCCNCENNHKADCKNISRTSSNKAIQTIKNNQFDDYLTETAKKQINEMNKNDPNYSMRSQLIYASIDDSDKVDIFIPHVSESEEDFIENKNYISSVKIGAIDEQNVKDFEQNKEQDEGIITIFNKNYHKDDNLDCEVYDQPNPTMQNFKGKFYMHDDRNMSEDEINSQKLENFDQDSCNSKTELPDSDFGDNCYSSFESKNSLDKILFGSKMDKYGKKVNVVTLTENGQLENKNKKFGNKKLLSEQDTQTDSDLEDENLFKNLKNLPNTIPASSSFQVRLNSKWGHDRFDDQKQKPKSDRDLVKEYGYDIRVNKLKLEKKKVETEIIIVCNKKVKKETRKEKRIKRDKEFREKKKVFKTDSKTPKNKKSNNDRRGWIAEKPKDETFDIESDYQAAKLKQNKISKSEKSKSQTSKASSITENGYMSGDPNITKHQHISNWAESTVEENNKRVERKKTRQERKKSAENERSRMKLEKFKKFTSDNCDNGDNMDKKYEEKPEIIYKPKQNTKHSKRMENIEKFRYNDNYDYRDNQKSSNLHEFNFHHKQNGKNFNKRLPPPVKRDKYGRKTYSLKERYGQNDENLSQYSSNSFMKGNPKTHTLEDVINKKMKEDDKRWSDRYGKTGYKDSYGKNGYGKDSYGKDVNRKDGYAKDGYSKDGYSKDGYSKDGYDKKNYNIKKDNYKKDKSTSHIEKFTKGKQNFSYEITNRFNERISEYDKRRREILGEDKHKQKSRRRRNSSEFSQDGYKKSNYKDYRQNKVKEKGPDKNIYEEEYPSFNKSKKNNKNSVCHQQENKENLKDDGNHLQKPQKQSKYSDDWASGFVSKRKDSKSDQNKDNSKQFKKPNIAPASLNKPSYQNKNHYSNNIAPASINKFNNNFIKTDLAPASIGMNYNQDSRRNYLEQWQKQAQSGNYVNSFTPRVNPTTSTTFNKYNPVDTNMLYNTNQIINLSNDPNTQIPTINPYSNYSNNSKNNYIDYTINNQLDYNMSNLSIHSNNQSDRNISTSYSNNQLMAAARLAAAPRPDLVNSHYNNAIYYDNNIVLPVSGGHGMGQTVGNFGAS